MTLGSFTVLHLNSFFKMRPKGCRKESGAQARSQADRRVHFGDFKNDNMDLIEGENFYGRI